VFFLTNQSQILKSFQRLSGWGGADKMAQWENLKTDGERIRWLSENLGAVMGMLHRETEQINALQQRVQVLEEEIEN
jgi:hypothetical protein